MFENQGSDVLIEGFQMVQAAGSTAKVSLGRSCPIFSSGICSDLTKGGQRVNNGKRIARRILKGRDWA